MLMILLGLSVICVSFRSFGDNLYQMWSFNANEFAEVFKAAVLYLYGSKPVEPVDVVNKPVIDTFRVLWCHLSWSFLFKKKWDSNLYRYEQEQN